MFDGTWDIAIQAWKAKPPTNGDIFMMIWFATIIILLFMPSNTK